MLVKLGSLDIGTKVRFPFSGFTATVMKQGLMGTIIQREGKVEYTVTTRDGESKQIARGHSPEAVSNGSEVEVC